MAAKVKEERKEKKRKEATYSNLRRQERKSKELYFRKCGYGERLFAEYYLGQRTIVPHDEWEAFMACYRRPLPVTFKLNGNLAGPERQALERALRQAAAPVPWAPASTGIWQAAAGVDKAMLRGDGP
eukprot:SAG22_NODE_13746_length_396_cov_0.858586_1_plen_126_part_10